jgi:thioredoxin reductase (NADPH)
MRKNTFFCLFLINIFSINFVFTTNDQKNLTNTVSEISSSEVLPVVIIGGGVGSLTSAVYLSRSGIKPVIIEGREPGGMITKSPEVKNWPGEKAISGTDLALKIKKQAIANGCDFFNEEVVNVDFSKKPFKITVKNVLDNKKREILTNSCIIGMGCESKKLKNISKSDSSKNAGYLGNGISTCAVCDGPLYQDQDVAVIGGNDSAIIEASYLSNIAKNVTLIVKNDKLKSIEEKEKEEMLLKKENVKIILNSKVIEIIGDLKKITHVVTKNLQNNKTQELKVDGVFVSIGSTPNTRLFVDKLKLDSSGYIVVNEKKQASVEGVYAIGDIVSPHLKQAVFAASDGSRAALAVGSYLQKLKSNFLSKIDEIKKDIKPENLDPENLDSKDEVSSIDVDSLKSPIYISSEEQFETILEKSKKNVIVDFYSSRCMPCKTISPLFDEKAIKHDKKMKFLKVEVKSNRKLFQKYEIRAMPTMIIFKKGEEIDRKIGSGDIIKYLNDLD